MTKDDKHDKVTLSKEAYAGYVDALAHTLVEADQA